MISISIKSWVGGMISNGPNTKRTWLKTPALKINCGPSTANLWSDLSPQKPINHDKMNLRQKVWKPGFDYQFCTKTTKLIHIQLEYPSQEIPQQWKFHEITPDKCRTGRKVSELWEGFHPTPSMLSTLILDIIGLLWSEIDNYRDVCSSWWGVVLFKTVISFQQYFLSLFLLPLHCTCLNLE